MNWWQNSKADKYTEVVSKINDSNDNSINWIDKCRLLFEALNKTWNDFYLYNKLNNLLNAQE